MRKVIFLILSMMAINGICTTMPSVQKTLSTQKNNKIDLAGGFPSTGTRSLSSPILLMQYSEYLEGIFFHNIGDIIIEIKDDMNNVVYRNIIDTNIEREHQISLLSYRKGNYRILFTNLRSHYMYGNFVIQE